MNRKSESRPQSEIYILSVWAKPWLCQESMLRPWVLPRRNQRKLLNVVFAAIMLGEITDDNALWYVAMDVYTLSIRRESRLRTFHMSRERITHFFDVSRKKVPHASSGKIFSWKAAIRKVLGFCVSGPDHGLTMTMTMTWPWPWPWPWPDHDLTMTMTMTSPWPHHDLTMTWIKQNPCDLWHLRHWFHFLQLRNLINDNQEWQWTAFAILAMFIIS